MIYCAVDQSSIDCTDPIRMNYVLPGIFPAKELIRERRLWLSTIDLDILTGFQRGQVVFCILRF